METKEELETMRILRVVKQILTIFTVENITPYEGYTIVCIIKEQIKKFKGLEQTFLEKIEKMAENLPPPT
jgi:hypothetical protein